MDTELALTRHGEQIDMTALFTDPCSMSLTIATIRQSPLQLHRRNRKPDLRRNHHLARRKPAGSSARRKLDV